MRSINSRLEKLEEKLTNKDGELGLIPIYKFSSLENAAKAFNDFRGTNFSSEDLKKWNVHEGRDGRWLMHPDFSLATLVLERKHRQTQEKLSKV